jgi:hypothetical protein
MNLRISNLKKILGNLNPIGINHAWLFIMSGTYHVRASSMSSLKFTFSQKFG